VSTGKNLERRIAEAMRWQKAMDAALDEFRCKGGVDTSCRCGIPGGCGNIPYAEKAEYDRTRATYEGEAAEILCGIAALFEMQPA
jgi:ferredoxin